MWVLISLSDPVQALFPTMGSVLGGAEGWWTHAHHQQSNPIRRRRLGRAERHGRQALLGPPAGRSPGQRYTAELGRAGSRGAT